MLAMHEVEIKLSDQPDGLGFIHGRARLGDRTVRVDVMPPDYLWKGDIKPDGEHKPDPTHWCVYADGELLARIEREEDVGAALVSLLTKKEEDC